MAFKAVFLAHASDAELEKDRSLIETSKLTNHISGEYGLMMSLVTVFGGYLFWSKRDELSKKREPAVPSAVREGKAMTILSRMF